MAPLEAVSYIVDNLLEPEDDEDAAIQKEALAIIRGLAVRDWQWQLQ